MCLNSSILMVISTKNLLKLKYELSYDSNYNAKIVTLLHLS